MAGRLTIFVGQVGELASKSPMGAVLKMLGPRLLGDLANVPEEQLAGYLRQLIDRLQYVLDGDPAPTPLSVVVPLALAAQQAEAESGIPPSTDR